MTHAAARGFCGLRMIKIEALGEVDSLEKQNNFARAVATKRKTCSKD